MSGRTVKRLLGGPHDRLVRHDGLLLLNIVRSVLSSRSDRLLLLIAIPIALAIAHATLARQPLVTAAGLAAAVAALIGAWTARTIARRIAFHGFDGVLAADAMYGRARRRYAVVVHGLTFASSCGVALAIRIEMFVVVPPAYAVGAIIGHLGTRWMRSDKNRPLLPRAGLIALHAQRPVTGAAAAAAILVLLLSTGSLDAGPRSAILCTCTALLGLALTIMDAGTVRFMAAAGYSAWRTLTHAARSSLVFLLLATSVSLALAGTLTAILVAAAGGCTLLLMALRILACRLYSGRTADMVVSLCVAFVVLTALTMPFLLPIILIAIIWWLYRAAAGATWRLA